MPGLLRRRRSRHGERSAPRILLNGLSASIRLNCCHMSSLDWGVYKSPKNSEPGAPSPAPRPRQAPAAPRENSSSQAPKAAPLIEEIPPAPAGPVWANGQGVVGKTFGAFLYFCV